MLGTVLSSNLLCNFYWWVWIKFKACKSNTVTTAKNTGFDVWLLYAPRRHRDFFFSYSKRSWNADGSDWKKYTNISHMCLWSSVLLKSGTPLALHSTPLLNGCINGYNILQGKAKGIKTLRFFCLFFFP